jgi:hypothetical protein
MRRNKTSGFATASMIALALWAISVSASTPAAARDLTIEDLLGRWCGDTTNYRFSRDRLTVSFHNGGNSRVLEIERVDGTEEWIDVHWIGAGNTVFTDFSDDKRVMYQAANTSGDNGPRRRFRRC